MENHFLIRILEWASNKTEGFTYDELLKNIRPKLKNWEQNVIDRYFQYAVDNEKKSRAVNQAETSETIFLQITQGYDFKDANQKFTLTKDAFFDYIDYKELVFATKNSKEARSLALWAILVSIISIVISALMPIYVAREFTQTIKLSDDQMSQYENLWKETRKDINLIRQTISRPKAEFQEASTTSTDQESYREIVEERQKKADEINNALFQLHQ